jgi:Raf kinase inhibitor-like YbhB/YbcL family protein
LKQEAVMALHLSSPAFAQGQAIPRLYSGEGKDLSPPLAWSDAPPGTRSLALIMDDPDAPTGTWVHWVVYDIPSEQQSLPEGLAKAELAGGVKQGASWGVDRFHRVGYYGPNPPPGKTHHYYFLLCALDRPLNLPPNKNAAEVRAAMKGHVLAEAVLMGTYRR